MPTYFYIIRHISTHFHLYALRLQRQLQIPRYGAMAVHMKIKTKANFRKTIRPPTGLGPPIPSTVKIQSKPNDSPMRLKTQGLPARQLQISSLFITFITFFIARPTTLQSCYNLTSDPLQYPQWL